MMKHFPTFKMKFTPDAIAHTVAPSSWSVLLSQRRRWINSTVHNLVELMTLPELCGFCCFSMRFVVFIDLLGTIVSALFSCNVADGECGRGKGERSGSGMRSATSSWSDLTRYIRLYPLPYHCRLDWQSAPAAHLHHHDCSRVRSSSHHFHLEARVHVDWLDAALHLGVCLFLSSAVIMILIGGEEAGE